MITIKTRDQIAKMQEAGKLLAACHREIAKRIKPGVSTREIDQFVERFLAEHGAIPEQKGYNGYEYATCASVNDVICHGFPSPEPLRSGDIVTIDMVVNLNGWLADSAWSYAVGEVSEEAARLLETTKRALYIGIEQARVGNRIGDISNAIQKFAEAQGYGVVREFTGHGIGTRMHEDPQVPHYGPAGRGMRLKEGMVITIEPMLNCGTADLYVEEDGWTARTWDGRLSAQYEHTIAITAGGPLILTAQD
ncbi:type I methionyl aminopeptidase [Paenibacillus thermoaerophilus]|uniref:Methionine aminopeptidase n=1 Tax=Paenibacillus thermoaerophilus TaxID=1215385 RepID=A0ABW2V3Y7_9BACL|nr:type I methionyl aminopeptidase [Paenibacillus thermoaerophilus]TMV14377.1 type I methionyl aminopeptidase [Paenibacillus thermoaerophilus]